MWLLSNDVTVHVACCGEKFGLRLLLSIRPSYSNKLTIGPSTNPQTGLDYWSSRLAQTDSPINDRGLSGALHFLEDPLGSLSRQYLRNFLDNVGVSRRV